MPGDSHFLCRTVRLRPLPLPRRVRGRRDRTPWDCESARRASGQGRACRGRYSSPASDARAPCIVAGRERESEIVPAYLGASVASTPCPPPGRGWLTETRPDGCHLPVCAEMQRGWRLGNLAANGKEHLSGPAAHAGLRRDFRMATPLTPQGVTARLGRGHDRHFQRPRGSVRAGAGSGGRALHIRVAS